MKYLDRINNKKGQAKKAQEFVGQKSRLQAEADLLEVSQQIVDEKNQLEKLRLAEKDYSLSRIGEQRLKIKDLVAVQKEMKAEFTADFS